MAEDLVAILCGGALLIVFAVLLLLGLRALKPYAYRRRSEGTNTCLTITAKRNLHKVTVTASFGGEEMTFERARVRKGQSVDFVFPSSDKKAKLVVEIEPGKPHSSEV
ncbi:MAG: hypothetical protein AB1324_01660 [Candidatus Micrarchaeota archaeon]